MLLARLLAPEAFGIVDVDRARRGAAGAARASGRTWQHMADLVADGYRSLVA